MLDPAIIQLLEIAVNEIMSNERAIAHKLDEVTTRLQSLQAKLDEQLLIGARQGVQHLLDGLGSESEEVRRDEFVLARREFAKLIELSPNTVTTGESGEVPNESLIGLGYWGNFHYFNLRGDRRNAIAQVYRCTRKLPLIGLTVFDKSFFSKDYLSHRNAILPKLNAEYLRLQQIEGDNFWKGVSYYGQKTVAYAGAASLGTGALIAALSFSPAAVHLARFAAEAANTRITAPAWGNTRNIRFRIALLEQELSVLFTELDRECASQLGEPVDTTPLESHLDFDAATETRNEARPYSGTSTEEWNDISKRSNRKN